MSIYGDLKNLEEMIENCFDEETGEIKQEDDLAYQELRKELLDDGLRRLACVRANKQNLIDGIKLEIERLKNRLKQETRDFDFVESYMIKLYDEAEKDSKGKVIAGTFKIGIRKSYAVEVDENFNNENYQTIEEIKKIDKMAIRKALQNGEEVDGARLVENKNLSVK